MYLVWILNKQTRPAYAVSLAAAIKLLELTMSDNTLTNYIWILVTIKEIRVQIKMCILATSDTEGMTGKKLWPTYTVQRNTVQSD